MSGLFLFSLSLLVLCCIIFNASQNGMEFAALIIVVGWV